MQKAVTMLSETCGSVTARSSVYETAAWGITDQPSFLNMVIGLDTPLAPEELLVCIHNVENTLGRQRDIKWGQRTLDIDILLYNHETHLSPTLTIPHPYLHLRRFTLAPLAEIAGQYVHPVLNKTISELLECCPDALEVHKM